METLEALQQEVDTLNSERRDLKEKLKSTTKRNLIDNIINKTSPEVSVDKSLSKHVSSGSLIQSDFRDQEV